MEKIPCPTPRPNDIDVMRKCVLQTIVQHYLVPTPKEKIMSKKPEHLDERALAKDLEATLPSIFLQQGKIYIYARTLYADLLLKNLRLVPDRKGGKQLFGQVQFLIWKFPTH